MSVFRGMGNWILLVVAFIVISVGMGIQRYQSTNNIKKQDVSVLSGGENGFYYSLAKDFAALSNVNLTVAPSAGSGINVQGILAGDATFAISQDDVAYHSFAGLKGKDKTLNLRTVIPLFPETIRILIPADSNINSLGDLHDKKICVGKRGSGTSYNAADVLSHISLIEGMHYDAVQASPNRCIEIINGLSSAIDLPDAVFVTSHIPVSNDGSLKELTLPESVIDGIIKDYKYYFKSQSVSPDGTVTANLNVYASLITVSSTPDLQVAIFVKELSRVWPDLQTNYPTLPNLKLKDHLPLVPFHSGASKSLESINNPASYSLITFSLSIWFTLLFLCLYAEQRKITYNRLGESSLGNTAQKWLVKFFGRFSKLLIGISAFLIFVSIAVFLLRASENAHARRLGEFSHFLDMGFMDSLMWLSTYIASGFTSDGVYPKSPTGQTLAALLAGLGIIGPFTLAFVALNAASKRSLAKIAGTIPTEIKKHTLICGWNEKASGIVYTLTGDDVDQKKSVVIVAELPDITPLSHYGFDPKHVTYIKGNGSDVEVLKRANAGFADSAIILANFGDDGDQNMSSVLTVMNLRRLSSEIHICAELEYEENRDIYSACGCNSFINSTAIISSLATTAITSPKVIDYILDTITYHKFDELYSVEVGEEPSFESFIGKPLRDIECSLLADGVNVIGMLKNNRREVIDNDATFTEGSHLVALVDRADSQTKLERENILIYASENRARIKKNVITNKAMSTLPTTNFNLNLAQKRRVLVCGDRAEIEAIKANLARYKDIAIEYVDIEINPLNTYEDVKTFTSGEFDTIIVLVPTSQRVSILSENDMHNIDARSILTSKLLQASFEFQDTEPMIISEIMSVRNKELFKDAGTDVFLPAILTIERLLTKEAYDRSNILDYITALLDTNDGVFLHAHKVKMGDGFCGNTYKDVLYAEIEGIRIVGWLPITNKEHDLKNKEGDFEYHFRTVIDSRHNQHLIMKGDLIIMIIRPRENYHSR